MTEAITKTCTKCGVAKGLAEFHRDAKGKHGRKSMCKPCNIAESSLYAKRHPEIVNARNARWSKANPEKRKQSNKRLKEKNIDHDRAQGRKRAACQVATLSDTYVARIITRGEFSSRLVPAELIEAKRISLLIIRFCKGQNP